MFVVQRLVSAALFASRAAVAAAVGIDAGLRTAVVAATRTWEEQLHAAADPPLETAALLIDLDNLGVRRARLPKVLGVLLEEAGPIRRALAAGHPTVVNAEVRQLCAELGVDVLAAEPGANGADRALLAAALELYATGVTTWYVASHDAVFSALPGTLTVLCTGGGRPAAVLA